MGEENCLTKLLITMCAKFYISLYHSRRPGEGEGEGGRWGGGKQ